jgi:DNA replication and repair protein RecF
LDAHTMPGEHTRTVKLVTEPRQAKTYELDERIYHRILAQHMLPVVLFEPNHLQLLHGSPQLRRDYLDDILEQTNPGFASFRRNYRRTLAQRNALLKRAKPPTSQELFPWDLRLSELGATITRARAELCEQLAVQLQTVYTAIAQVSTEVSIQYLPKFQLESYESQLLSKLENHLREDIQRGFTTYGPHREDFVVTFDGRHRTTNN